MGGAVSLWVGGAVSWWVGGAVSLWVGGAVSWWVGGCGSGVLAQYVQLCITSNSFTVHLFLPSLAAPIMCTS